MATRGEKSKSFPAVKNVFLKLIQADPGLSRFISKTKKNPATTATTTHTPIHLSKGDLGPLKVSVPALQAKPTEASTSKPAKPSRRSIGIVARMIGNRQPYQRA